jgi:hypothetical protein
MSGAPINFAKEFEYTKLDKAFNEYTSALIGGNEEEIQAAKAHYLKLKSSKPSTASPASSSNSKKNTRRRRRVHRSRKNSRRHRR